MARPKGVMLTHRNCYLNAYSFMVHLCLCHDDVELWAFPMFHCRVGRCVCFDRLVRRR
ncbi:MAG: hypothetical protein M2R46_02124 [Verrucomicrobia subdivision 3 bacterium]|nr:hypothetical protein [Limisphaerales bacterium]